MQTTKTCNRLICLLLSCIMVIQIMPLSIFAAESSGICGGGVTWHLDGDVLYIEGEGETYDFLSQWDTDDNPEDKITLPPWIGKSVTKIVVGEGVTYIGNKAFYEMSDVVEVVLPSTLKGIGYYAFSYMSKLEIVNLPEGLETMGHSAFSACAALENITIPSTLKVIPQWAFWQCTSLTDLTISYGVEEIGEGAFDGCSGIGAEGDGANDLSTMFDGPGLQRVEIPGSVKTIGFGAFTACSMLREVILHEGIERIGGGAFNNCNSLYDVTLPSSLKTMGEWVFDHLGGNLDSKLDELGIPVTRLQNVYILSRELSLKATEDYDTDMAWFNEWRPFAMFHVYEDSVAAGELDQYNLQTYFSSYIPDCGHELGAFVSDDENTHTRTCTEDDCTASQTVRHTLTVDLDNLTMEDCETALRYRLYCTACDYVGEFVTKEAAGHEISGYYDYYDEEYHESYCWKCSQYVQEPHNWEYDEDPTAAEPYEVEAYCTDCDRTMTITVLPAETTIISIKAKDENGNDAALPEDSFTVYWEDSAGNVLAEGTTYAHSESWIVNEDNPVVAVISFSDDVRQAYNTGDSIRHKVTVLGEKTEYVLTPRDLLTVKGRLMVDGYEYPPVDALQLTITTELAGNKSTIQIQPDSSGYFTAQIRRTPARLVYSSFPYESVVIDNVQMFPVNADGIIDVGTLTLQNRMQWYYKLTLDNENEKTLAQRLVNAGTPLTVINNTTGAEYTGAKLEYENDGNSAYLEITFGMDLDEYFATGDSVTVSCARTGEIIFEPVTFNIVKQTDPNIHDVTLYVMPKLEISLDKAGRIFIFDSDDHIIFDGYQKTYAEYLPVGTYTYVIFEQSYRVPEIEDPGALERLGIPSENYLKGTVNLINDVTLGEFILPSLYIGGRMAMAVTFDTDMQSDNLIPMYLNFNHVFHESYENGETIEFTLYSGGSIHGVPFGTIGDRYAFSSDVDVLSEEVILDGYSHTYKLKVTVGDPRGTLALFIKPVGTTLTIRARSSSGDSDYYTIRVPSLNETSIKIIDPSGRTENADSFVTLYTKLSDAFAPYTGHLYVNGELECEKELKLTGQGINHLDYKLQSYDDGLSNHRLYVEITDKNGEIVWVSNEYTVTLVDDWWNSNEPKELLVRTKWLAGHVGENLVDRINLQSNPGTGHRFYVQPKSVNADGTLNVETVFNYSLKMTNDTPIANDTVMMKVFCGESLSNKTIHDVKLLYNKETGRYEGTLTLEANEYTVYDLPYGYSFDYSLAGGSSGSGDTGSLGGGYSFSMEQFVEEIEEQAATYIVAQEGEPYEYYDPDDVEFAIGNMEGLSEEEKQMMRTLLAISNDFYNLQQVASQSSVELSREMLGGNTVSDSPAEGIQDILAALNGDIESDSTTLTADDLLSNMDYTEIDTSKIGDDLDMVLDSFYMKTDVESLQTQVVDPNSGVEFTVDHNAIVSGGSTGGSFMDALKVTAESFYNGAISCVDLVLDATAKVRKYLDNELVKKLGQQMDIENLEEGIKAWKDSLAEIEARVHPIDWGDNYEKSIFEAQQKALDDILESRQTRDTIANLEQTLKELRSDLANTKLNIENCQRVAGSKFRKYQRVLGALDSKWAKGIFIGVDILLVVRTVIVATEAFDKCIANNEHIEQAERQADRMKNALTSACPNLGNASGYYDQWDECSEAHAKLVEYLDSARSWNENILYVKYGQVIGELASFAAGLALKGPQGIIVSLGLGIIGGGSEWFALEKFIDALEKSVEMIPKVESACLEASQDPSLVEKDCKDPDGGNSGGEEDDPNGGIPGGNGASGNEKPQYPVPQKVLIDPSGYVYEAVASNRIEGATAKVYYENSGEEVYWAEAGDYGEINPQITGMDGRFAWMTPIGSWRVKVEKDGYLPADSNNDPAAVDGWLPVPPPQLDVNIAMISTDTPTVLSAGAASDQIRVVFSQYMDIAQMKEGLVTVTQNGQPISVDIVFEDAEVSPTKDGVYYGRIMKLTRTDGTTFSGEGIVVAVAASARNYAGTALGTDYTSGSLAVTQLVGSLSHSYPNRFVTDIGKDEQIAVQVLDSTGKPMASVTVTARQIVGGTLSMTESAVSDTNGTAVFTMKGLSAGSDVILFSTNAVSTELNTCVSPRGNKAPQKPTANLNDYEVVEKGTQLVLACATEGAVIYYTTNNTCPCTDSAERKIYTGPIEITEDTFFRIAAWTEVGGYSERLNLHITAEIVEEVLLYGDINDDGKVDNTDSIRLKEYFAGYSVMIKEELADVNRDGSVTRADAMILARHLAGWKGYSLPYRSGS